MLQLSVACDENECHLAVLYCTVCTTHLCLECSEASHSTRTLAKHPRVPLSEKPKENPKCVYHPMHLVEFACLEEECASSPLMCYICKDYGRHVKHKVYRLLWLLWEFLFMKHFKSLPFSTVVLSGIFHCFYATIFSIYSCCRYISMLKYILVHRKNAI